MSMLDVTGKNQSASHTARFTSWTVQPRRFVVCEVFLLLRLLVHLVGRTEVGKCAQQNTNWIPEETNLLVLYLEWAGTEQIICTCLQVYASWNVLLSQWRHRGCRWSRAPNLILLHSLKLFLLRRYNKANNLLGWHNRENTVCILEFGARKWRCREIC